MDILDIAKSYAAADLVPVPTNASSKRPIGDWKDWTATPAQHLKAWPRGAGIGFLTGPSNLVVVDLDVKNRDKAGRIIDGLANWDALLARLGLQAYPVHETTPSGGAHIYFHADDSAPIRNSASASRGIDVRGIGGFCVAAPTDGYQFTAGTTAENFPSKIYAMPAPLLAHFTAESRTTLTYSAPKDSIRLSRTRERIADPKAAVVTLLADLANGDTPGGSAPGNQSNAIFFTATRIWELEPFAPGLADSAYPELLAVIATLPTSGDVWSEDAVASQWRSARRTAEEQPLSMVDMAESGSLGHALTDLGNADRLLDHMRERGTPVHWTAGAGWLLWDGKRWEIDRLNRVASAAQVVARKIMEDAGSSRDQELISELAEEANELSGGKRPGEDNEDMSERSAQLKDVRRRMGRLIKDAANRFKWAEYSQSAKGMTAMQQTLQALPGVTVSLDTFDTTNHLLNVDNGTLDLRTATLRPHDPADKLTKLVHFPYRAGARADRWRAFLTEVFEHPDMPEFYQRLIGYGCSGETTEQCLALQYGRGRNGKTLSTEVLRHVFAEYSYVTDFATFEERRTSGSASPEIIALRGARFVFASEGNSGVPLAESTVKKLTGAEHITARDLYKSPVTFMPTALIVLSTNHLPLIKGADNGIWRRMKLLPWSITIPLEKQDVRLAERLKREEAEGILAWAVQGALSWYAEGLQEPPTVAVATVEYRGSQDALSGFFPGRLIKDPGASMALKDAYLEYQNWCDSEGLKNQDVWAKRTFQRAMDEREVPTEIGHARARILKGIRKARATDTPDAPPTVLKPVLDTPTQPCFTGPTSEDIATAFGETP